MNIVATPTFRRVVVFTISLCLGIPEPPIRDVERAMILRFLCIYECTRNTSHLASELTNNNKKRLTK